MMKKGYVKKITLELYYETRVSIRELIKKTAS